MFTQSYADLGLGELAVMRGAQHGWSGNSQHILPTAASTAVVVAAVARVSAKAGGQLCATRQEALCQISRRTAGVPPAPGCLNPAHLMLPIRRPI